MVQIPVFIKLSVFVAFSTNAKAAGGPHWFPGVLEADIKQKWKEKKEKKRKDTDFFFFFFFNTTDWGGGIGGFHLIYRITQDQKRSSRGIF